MSLSPADQGNVSAAFVTQGHQQVAHHGRLAFLVEFDTVLRCEPVAAVECRRDARLSGSQGSNWW